MRNNKMLNLSIFLLLSFFTMVQGVAQTLDNREEAVLVVSQGVTVDRDDPTADILARYTGRQDIRNARELLIGRDEVKLLSTISDIGSTGATLSLADMEKEKLIFVHRENAYGPSKYVAQDIQSKGIEDAKIEQNEIIFHTRSLRTYYALPEAASHSI
ncbi:MAG: hypothetical protein K0S08_1812 [Gammaproteobacteria bacterium]|nr:hypothetical protein [Gammaproteobacteria bacterium]